MTRLYSCIYGCPHGFYSILVITYWSTFSENPPPILHFSSCYTIAVFVVVVVVVFVIFQSHTLGMALLDIVRMVTIVSTDVTPRVTRAGDWFRGSKKVSQESVTIRALGPYR